MKKKLTIGRKVLNIVIIAVLASCVSMVASGRAFGATGSEKININGGTLSVGNVVNGTIIATIGNTASGGFPSAAWSDLTGTGNGWNGTIALTSFTYTGAWVTASGTQALASTNSGAYNDAPRWCHLYGYSWHRWKRYVNAIYLYLNGYKRFRW